MTDTDDLAAFARDTVYTRLVPPVVDRRAVLCDACGAERPRVLHVLRDGTAGGLSFVGEACLEVLAARDAVGRRTTRARTERAYEAELDRRAGAAPPAASPAPTAAEAAAPSPDHATGALLVVAVVRPGEWGALLELVGARDDACLVVPLCQDLPALAGAALPLDRISDFAARAAAARGP